LSFIILLIEMIKALSSLDTNQPLSTLITPEENIINKFVTTLTSIFYYVYNKSPE